MNEDIQDVPATEDDELDIDEIRMVLDEYFKFLREQEQATASSEQSNQIELVSEIKQVNNNLVDLQAKLYFSIVIALVIIILIVYYKFLKNFC